MSNIFIQTKDNPASTTKDVTQSASGTAISLPKPVCQTLLARQQITEVADPDQQLTLERSSLSRLRNKTTNTPAQGYLNAYDRLFRHISLLLLAHGYAITEVQPHQTLRKICQQWQSDELIMCMIAERHYLKKTPTQQASANLTLDPQAKACLTALLAVFDEDISL